MFPQRKRNNIRIDQPLQDSSQEHFGKGGKGSGSANRTYGAKQEMLVHNNIGNQYAINSKDYAEKTQKQLQNHFQTSASQDFTNQAHTEKKVVEAEANKKQAQNSQNQQIQSEYNYDQLSQQLSKALTKIQSKGKAKPQTFLDRVEYFEKKKQKWLHQVKQQKQLQQSKLCLTAPLTNTNSQKMLQFYEPIHSRYEKIVEQKKRKIEKFQMDRSLKQRQQEQKYLKQPKSITNLRTKQQFVSSVYSWKEKKQQKIIKLMQEQKKSEMQGVTFKPVINGKSKLMVKKLGKVPIYEQEIKVKRIQIDEECTFQPDLTKSKK